MADNNEIEITVTSSNKTKPGFEAAKAESKVTAKSMQDDFDKTGAASEKQAGRVKKSNDVMSKSVADFDRLVHQHVDDQMSTWETLASRIDKTKASIISLRQETNRTGSASVFGDLKTAESDLKTLEGFAKDLAPQMGQAGANAGTQFAAGFGNTMTGGSGDLGTVFKVALIGAAVAVSPPIISLVGSAVATGVGAAGIGVGIYEATHDPRVKSDLHSLGGVISREFSDATKSFIGPTLQGIDIIKADFAGIGPDLKSTFSELSKYVVPLASGLSGAGVNLLHGLEEGMKGAEPLILELSHLLPGLGKAVGDMFDKFGHGGAGAQLALKSLVGLIEMAVEGIGSLYQWSTKAFLSIEQEAVHVENAFGDIVHAMGVATFDSTLKKMGDSLHNNANEMQNQIDSAKAGAAATSDYTSAQGDAAAANYKTAASIEDLISAQDKEIGTLQTADDSLLALKKSQLAWQEGFKKGKKYWDEDTAAGQKNVGLLLDYSESLKRRYDDLAAIHPLTLKQTQAEEDATQKLYDQAVAAGATSDEVATLATKISDLRAQIKLLKNKQISITVHENVVFHADDPQHWFHGLATGGIVSAAANGGPKNGMTWVGERGPELVKLPTGSMVYPSGQSQQMATQAAASGGPGPVSLTFLGATNSDFAQLIMKLIRTGVIQLKVGSTPVTV